MLAVRVDQILRLQAVDLRLRRNLKLACLVDLLLDAPDSVVTDWATCIRRKRLVLVLEVRRGCRVAQQLVVHVFVPVCGSRRRLKALRELKVVFYLTLQVGELHLALGCLKARVFAFSRFDGSLPTVPDVVKFRLDTEEILCRHMNRLRIGRDEAATVRLLHALHVISRSLGRASEVGAFRVHDVDALLLLLIALVEPVKRVTGGLLERRDGLLGRLELLLAAHSAVLRRQAEVVLLHLRVVLVHALNALLLRRRHLLLRLVAALAVGSLRSRQLVRSVLSRVLDLMRTGCCCIEV